VKNKYSISIIGLVLSAFFASCTASADASDLNRVKQQFLQMRFQSVLVPELKNKTDLELFQLSCAQNRMNCDQILQMLQSSDPEFYKTLTGTKTEPQI